MADYGFDDIGARNGRYLWVLDNADDENLISHGIRSNKRGPLARFLLQVAHGSMLITLRNGLAARNAVALWYMIEIQPMNKDTLSTRPFLKRE